MTEFQQADGVGDWRVLDTGASAWFDAPSMTAGAALVRRIAGLTATTGLPDLDLRPGGVRVRIAPVGDLTRAEVELACSISAAANDLGLAANPSVLQTVRLVIESGNEPSLVSFWQTVLAYEPVGASRIGDPSRRDPVFSFHKSRPRPLRDRIHVDVVRASDAVEAVRAAVGQQPFGAYGVALADDDGNVVDLVPGDMLSEGPETADWQVLFGAMAFYAADSPARAGELASAVAGLADDAGLPLMVDLRPDGVTIDSGKDQWEDGEGSATSRFVDLAGRIQTAARNLGLSADATRPRFVQLGMDAVDVPMLRAFWTSVLGYQHDVRASVTDIYDPRRLNPVLFFQSMDASDTDRRQHRNRVHLELFVPDDQAQARIDAAVAAGGRIVNENAPECCTLVDPEGNEVDIVSFRRA
ncbi:VOC family protein [Hamadaea tsunoensis]|uniref:VOC family protein n=1 Tax=Hamadaea tsunoensis TaxID=53368 RepID=UPI0003F7EBE5|nr:VOC family protein [Hamadaea tsunoensis]